MSERVIKIGLLGLGTVGGGVYRVLQGNRELIGRKVGARIEIKRILVRDVSRDRGLSLPADLLTTDPEVILGDPAIEIVVEVMGGTGAALDHVRTALSRGKSVVTANKDMLAVYGKELFALAQEKGTDLLFEASVAGGIPIIRVLKQCLAANRIEMVMGILNGTTNYMLSKMTAEGRDFQDVLREAQELGYAEADPTNDVEGYDAARKTAILASIAFNTRISFQDVYVEGISSISAEDITYATELGYVIKLLGIAKDTPEGIEVRTHPVLLPQAHPLATVTDSFNAVYVRGDAVGETMFYGRGAGALPTASAVTADIMDAARNIVHRVPGIISCTCFEERPLKEMGRVRSKNYLRLKVIDRPGVLAQIARVFGDHQVSLAAVTQKDTEGEKAELVLITHEVAERNLRDSLAELEQLAVVEKICNVLRVEGDG
ncbi:MAG: homoserine dehydrogenase [Candidatus Desulforudis sp.]|nr:homoserine dehydrogenase [Desulforudis sp.]